MKIELTFTADGRYRCDGLPSDSGIFIAGLNRQSARNAGEGAAGLSIGNRQSCKACPRFTWCPLSHVAAVLAEIDNLDALEAACKELGLTFVHGQKTWKWFGQWVNDYHGEDAAYKHGITPEEYGKCAHAIKVPGSNYEIGVKQMPNGKYQMVYDFYGAQGRHIVNTLGKGLETLVKHYGLNRSQIVARAKGLITQRKVLTTGKVIGTSFQHDIKLVVTGIK